MQSANYVGGMITFPESPESWNSINRVFIFNTTQNGNCILRWTWCLDAREPGYLLVSERIALGPDVCWTDEWPFFQIDYDLEWEERHREWRKWDARRERHEAAKARKERARTGQKRSKSKMPGT
ncbi:hypothetical protein EK21DRAFT_86080 [Setomelanomma holmii]|uniref:Uncharacterized protein n=1 Tax=Setomelanomma holmii TaxID=210430 RepID=A0A9P4LNA1_9PLEO|nr:hypothetical protein EK21DRAFT_86080 [Setomelanomma holmii]